MKNDIDKVKESVKNIIRSLSIYNWDQEMVKFAFVSYKDHDNEKGEPVLKSIDFSDEETVFRFIDSINADILNNDAAEAVIDGINRTTTLSWR